MQVIDYKGLTYIEEKEERESAAKALAAVPGRYVGEDACEGGGLYRTK